MKSSRTIRLTLLGALLAVVVATPALASDTETGTELQAWALDRYAEAGLELPDVEIHLHDDLDACEGSFGLHTAGAAKSRIDVCTDPQVDPHWIILHELGHAWASLNLDDQQRDRLVVLRWLEAWNDQDARWNERGTEHAAEILAWGLTETSRLPGRIADHDPASVTEAFRFLTDTEPICDDNGSDAPAPPEEANNRRGGPLA